MTIVDLEPKRGQGAGLVPIPENLSDNKISTAPVMGLVADDVDTELPTVNPTWIIGTLAFAEFAFVILSAIAAKLAYIDAQFLGSQSTLPYAGVAFVHALIVALTFRYSRLYDPRFLWQPTVNATRLLLALCTAFLLLVALLYVLKVAEQFSRGWMLIWFVSCCVMIIGGRCVFKLYCRLLVAEGRLKQRVAVYGNQELVPNVLQHLRVHAPQVSVVASFTERAAEPERQSDVPSEELESLLRLGQANRFDRVIVALPASASERIRSVVSELRVLPVDVQYCSALLNLPVQVFGSSNIGQMQLLALQRRPIPEQGLVLKSLLDYGLSASLLVVLSPLLLIIAAAIKLDSPGPVFFSQRRQGYNKKVIRVLKFRSMKVMEDGNTIKQAEKHDRRVTSVGWYLRRASLDELPQLLNVLRGEMSLVGPRPHAIAHDELYSEKWEQYAHRHRVKPGITGWAQVNGFRGETKNPELMRRRVELDLEYIDSWSLTWDLKILAMTVLAVLKGDEAH